MTALLEAPLYQWVKIVQITGPDDLSIRLAELGFLPGVEVRVVSQAPWGGPFVVELPNSRLALRESEAQCIQVHLKT